MASAFVICSGFSWATGNLPAWADTPDFVAPDRQIIDINGVDWVSGGYTRQDSFMQIGDSGSGLIWGFTGHKGTDTYSGNIVLVKNATPPYETKVRIAGSTDSFHGDCASSCSNATGQPNTLVKTAANWVYTTGDGTVYYFDILALTDSTYVTINEGRLSSIVKPNGNKVTISYTEATGCTPLTQLCGYSINNVVSNQGYGFKYVPITTGYGGTTIYAVNLLAHTCDASLVCDAYDSHIDYKNVDGWQTYSVTAPAGEVTQYTLADQGYYDVEVMTDAALPSGQTIHAAYDAYSRVKTLTTVLGTSTYSYSDNTLSTYQSSTSRTITATIPDGGYTAVVNKTYQLPASYKDKLNRTTTYTPIAISNGYKSYGRIGKVLTPEVTTSGGLPNGGYTEYTYSGSDVTAISKYPKGGGTALVTTANYGISCTTSRAACHKPTWTKDAKGNQTDYTYDNVHGGVLTVTLPANNDGIRTRTYNTYTIFNTGNGNIYRLTRSETCGLTSAQLTLTACPADINTSVTLTDYGTSSTAPYTYKSNQPYQVTVRDNRASGYDSQTTTYGYDKIGNVTSVDGPLAGAVDQSFTTFDANRRKRFAIGPIPGGAGTQKRSLVRHTYTNGLETQTAQGYANSNLTDGSDAVFTSYTRMTYDAAGRLIKSEAIVTGNAVP
ncbi:hypothetical protein [Asticcacaulis taihuensis]|nr:hypothetical protein [Asticcacaulis taihuensis]